MNSLCRLNVFDASDYLDNEVINADYLNAVLEDPNPEVILAAIADVAKTRGMTQLTKRHRTWSRKPVQVTGLRCEAQLRHHPQAATWTGGETPCETGQ